MCPKTRYINAATYSASSDVPSQKNTDSFPRLTRLAVEIYNYLR